MSLEERIIYEDNHLIAVNKVAGELSQGDQTGDRTLGDLVKDYLKQKYHKPGNVFLGTVHRLDRPVSGVILFARTSKALERLTKIWRDRKVEKTYWALVRANDKLSDQRLEHYLKRLPGKNITKAYDKQVEGSKQAVLEFKVIEQMNRTSLLEVTPQTGRQHQIRVQLAKIGCPVIGDLKYGFPNPNDDASICLHARKLVFTHPVKQESIILIADPPAGFPWKVLN